MALINTDLFIVERSGVQYKMTADAIADFVGAVRDYTTATITSRNLLTGLNVGDRVFVTDASGDATVTFHAGLITLAEFRPNTIFEGV